MSNREMSLKENSYDAKFPGEKVKRLKVKATVCDKYNIGTRHNV